MGKSCIKVCHGLATLYRVKGGILKNSHNIFIDCWFKTYQGFMDLPFENCNDMKEVCKSIKEYNLEKKKNS